MELERVSQAQDKSPSSAGSQQPSLVVMEAVMREEIRELQEQRAAAMMTEIVELQKERDLAMGKAKRLEKKVKDLESEVTEMKSKARTEVKGDLVGLLRQALLEEQLLSKDLKRKLQSVKSMNASLSEQLQEARQSPDTLLRRRSSSFDSKSASPLTSSSSLTPQPERKTLPTHDKPPTPSTHSAQPIIITDTLSPAGTKATVASPLVGSSMGYSPTVVPRRYKLATIASQEASTQTQPSPPSHTSPPSPPSPPSHTSPTSPPSHISPPAQDDSIAPPILEALKSAREDIVRLQRERDAAEERAGRESRKQHEIKKESESLVLECAVLRDALSEFSRWVRERLEKMEDNMDIFKVIYSLHGSLSQEQSVLKDLQHRLQQSEQKVLQLTKTNRQLVLEAAEAKEQYQQTLTLSPSALLTPPLSTTSQLLKGRKFSSPQLHLKHSSTLTTHTPSHPHTLTQDIV